MKSWRTWNAGWKRKNAIAAPMRIRWAVMRRTPPSLHAEDGLDRVARDGDRAVHLGGRDDERRRVVDGVAGRRMRAGRRPRACHQSAIHHLRLDPWRDLAVAGEVLLRRAVLDQLERGQQPLPAPDVADVRVTAER